MLVSPAKTGNDDLFSLAGKLCIITGAAGGLGSAIARGFAVRGAKLVLADLDLQKLKPLQRRVESLGATSESLQLDVTNPKQVETVCKRLATRYRRLDVLVNVHGTNIRAPTEEMSTESWEKVINVNLKGTFLMCQGVGKRMLRQGSGKIINMSSFASEFGHRWGYSAYSPSKAGVNGLTRALAVEWGKRGVNVNAVAPYFIATDMTKAFLSDPRIGEEIVKPVPMGRLGKPEDVVGVVIFLASAASDWVTGQVIHADGGRSVV